MNAITTTYDVCASFLGEDPQTGPGTFASMGGGLLIVGDFGACMKNLTRKIGWRQDAPPNYLEASFAFGGLCTTFAELTGAGVTVDAVMAGGRQLATHLATNPLAVDFVNCLNRILWDVLLLRREAPQGVTELVAEMVSNPAVREPLAISLQNEKTIEVAARLFKDNGDKFAVAIQRNFDAYGVDVSEAMVKVFDGAADDVFNALKALPESEFDEALDGLAKVLNKGIDPEALKRVLNNTYVYGTQYKQGNLMRDLGLLAEQNVEGISLLIDALKSGSVAVRGVRYELEGARHLIEDGKQVVEVTKRIGVGNGFGPEDASDIDVVVLEGTELIYYQFKSSKRAFQKEGTTMVNAAKAWITKAATNLDLSVRQAINNGHIRYAVPSLDDVPPSVQSKVFNADALGGGILAIPVDVVPITP